jgi:hypothetical protein
VDAESGDDGGEVATQTGGQGVQGGKFGAGVEDFGKTGSVIGVEV